MLSNTIGLKNIADGSEGMEFCGVEGLLPEKCGLNQLIYRGDCPQDSYYKLYSLSSTC